MRKKLLIALAFAAVVLGVLVTRAVWEGRRALRDGDAAAARGDTGAAIDHWRRAARWYVPAAPHVAAAYGRLERVATAAEAAGDRATALAAWRGIRSSVLATRSFFTPHADRKAVADRHIAALMAAEPVWGQPAPAGADPDPSWRAAPDAGDTAEARQAFYARQLARDDAPSLAWVAIALAGFGLWIGGAIHFARRGLDDAERLDRRVAGAAGGLVLLGLVVWVVGLYNA